MTLSGTSCCKSTGDPTFLTTLQILRTALCLDKEIMHKLSQRNTNSLTLWVYDIWDVQCEYSDAITIPDSKYSLIGIFRSVDPADKFIIGWELVRNISASYNTI